MKISGFVTSIGTTAYANRRETIPSFYRQVQDGIAISSVGLGSYLGQMNEAADQGYVQAVIRAVQGGINFIDTSLNYRHQRSERNIGTALAHIFDNGIAAREEVAICTKAGFLVPGATPSLPPSDVVGEMHSMSPAFLRDQADRSRLNLNLATLDVLYLHNPETQLEFLNAADFYQRIRLSFETLEQMAAAGEIRWYGAATWNGFRQAKSGLDLRCMESIAREVAGGAHRFRFIQLPFNLGMLEAMSLRDTGGQNVLDVAGELGITAVASASLLQARLARDLPPVIRERVTGFDTDAQRALQFARSAPGISVALTGMGQTAHVDENLGVAKVPPLTAGEFAGLFR